MLQRLIPFLVLALSAAFAWAGPQASGSEAHGIVDRDIARPAHDLYEVFFLSVDGQNLNRERQQILLTPGIHRIRFGVVFTDHAMLAYDNGRKRNPDQNEIEIDVKEGTRYSVAAKLEGHRGDEWKPVVTETTYIK